MYEAVELLNIEQEMHRVNLSILGISDARSKKKQAQEEEETLECDSKSRSKRLLRMCKWSLDDCQPSEWK